MYRGLLSIMFEEMLIEGVKYKRNSWIGYIAVKSFKYFKILKILIEQLRRKLSKIMEEII